MCGISGIIGKNGFDVNLIHEMTAIVSHRGKDDEGYLFINNSDNIITAGGIDTPKAVWGSELSYTPKYLLEKLPCSNARMAFGHRRLSIIDLSVFGHCPMSYDNNRFWITYNGEIYNYKQLKVDLVKLGHDFVSNSDTEVILAAYKEWGLSAFDRFVGMWAFAIYDKHEDTIVLSRDRYGIKPLYYWFSPEGLFCFGSEIKQFTQIPGWEACINPQRAYDYLIYALTDHTDETMFTGVYHIPSGSCFKSKLDEIKVGSDGRLNGINRWYKVKDQPFKGSFNEASKEFCLLFKESIRLHLQSDVPVGSALSGGLDSSAIVCEIKNILKAEKKQEIQKTFSSCSTDPRFDERKWVDIVAEYSGVDSHIVYPSYTELFKLTPRIIWHMDEPYQSQSVYLGYHVFEDASRNNIPVLLNGQGADEYLGGYNQFAVSRLTSLLFSLKFKELLEEFNNLKELSRMTIRFFLRNFFFEILHPRLRLFFSKNIGSGNAVKKLINKELLKATNKHPYNLIPEYQKNVKSISKHLTFYSTLPKYLRWEDRNSMAHSIEARVPFLDHRLVEFSFNLPDEYLFKNAITKRVMREGLKNILPEAIRLRKGKMGFETPEENWVRKDYTDEIRQKLIESIKISNGIINNNALDYFDRVVEGKIRFDYTYWRLILFGEWIKCFNVKII